MTAPDADPKLTMVGRVIRQQRELASLSLRQLAKLSNVSNAYLSQIERGLHEPSVRVLRAVSEALAVPLEQLIGEDTEPTHAESPPAPDLVAAIEAEPQLTSDQKQALIAVYRAFSERDLDPS